MTFDEYRKLAFNTCAQLNTEEHFAHMSAGITTELGEIIDVYKKKIAYKKPIDLVNIKEEIGDVLWYCGSWFHYYLENMISSNLKSINLPEWYKEEIALKNDLEVLYYLQNSLKYFLEATDCYKTVGISAITHRTAYLRIFRVICTYANFMEFNIEEIAQTNIAKLKTRYPDKFDAEKAINRDLNAERKVLEK